jgi:hypothetical protein
VKGEADERGLGKGTDVFDGATGEPEHAELFAGGEGADVGHVGVDDIEFQEGSVFEGGEIASRGAAEVEFFEGHATEGGEVGGDGVFEVEFDDRFATEGAEVGDGGFAEVEGEGGQFFDKPEVFDFGGSEDESDGIAFADFELAVASVGGVVVFDLRVKHFIRPVDALGSGWGGGG